MKMSILYVNMNPIDCFCNTSSADAYIFNYSVLMFKVFFNIFQWDVTSYDANHLETINKFLIYLFSLKEEMPT